MENDKPKVSIGLAVYNGERYLEEAVNSILGQTYGDFELIISDNASTDRTAEIGRAYAARDARVRYHRNPTNIGGANNENRTVEMARGEYFRWAADDDVCAPALLEKCVAVLDADPSIVLAYTTIIKIDAEGNPLTTLDRDYATSSRPSERFQSLIDWDHDCETTYGLIRTEALRRTGLQRNYTDSDRTLLAHLSLLGRFHRVPEPLFYKRIHPGMSTLVYSDWRERMIWFDAANRNRVTLPHWMQFLHYLEIIADAPLSLAERLRCYAHMGHWLIEWRRWGKMVNDIVIAGRKKAFGMRGRPLLSQ